ncbi:MAG: hypothetical protein H0W68_11995 [Gemmatimonadaceae bacterium]|nr:hypothetical protein [Gemmatimonadaceae bacterium]
MQRDALVGRSVLSLEVSEITGDLVLTLDGLLTLTTVVSDSATDELWLIRDNATKHRLVLTGRQLCAELVRYQAAFKVLVSKVDTHERQAVAGPDWAVSACIDTGGLVLATAHTAVAQA